MGQNFTTTELDSHPSKLIHRYDCASDSRLIKPYSSGSNTSDVGGIASRQ
jgi:hypothetical protein